MDTVPATGNIGFPLMLLFIVITGLIITVRTLWIIRRLNHHPHMEPLAVARPSIAPCIELMVAQICRIACIDIPPIHILRSQHPNAFIFSTFRKKRLILTDELLEEADQHSNGVDFLEKIICHEIAHIALRHGPRLYLLTVLERLIPTPLTHRMSEARLKNIETEADTWADILFLKLNAHPDDIPCL